MLRMLPRSPRPRWQDIPAWRHSVLELLRLALAGHDGPVIVPGTLVDRGHFQEIIGRLRSDGAEVHHFALLAEPATVVRRLRAQPRPGAARCEPWSTGTRQPCVTSGGTRAPACMRWSLRKLVSYLARHPGRVVVIGRERWRPLAGSWNLCGRADRNVCGTESACTYPRR
jgi:hypothetical protein